jgi:hypothetical protein
MTSGRIDVFYKAAHHFLSRQEGYTSFQNYYRRLPKAMNESDSLVLEFRLADSDDVAPAEFRYLFEAIDELTRSRVVAQMQVFVEMADISDRAREEVYASLFRLSRYAPQSAEVISVRHESPWSILVGLPVAAVVWAMRKMIAPEIVQAWNESQLKENFRHFVRDGLFRGAKEQLEASAAVRPQYGNLVVDDISELAFRGPDETAVRVILKRTEVLQVEVKDRELMKEFLARIGFKQ